MSLVLICPSTVIRSIEPASAPRRAESASSTTASVWTKQSIVAKPGSIIPAPFAWAETVTPPARSVHCFGARSVVMIAVVKSVAPDSLRAPAASRTPVTSDPTSRGTPMTPVSPIATEAASRPSASAAASRIAAASLMPCSPVEALALPEFTATARMPVASTSSRQSLTGAAAAALAVSAIAERTSGASQATIPTSVAPPALRPHATPEARNPGAS